MFKLYLYNKKLGVKAPIPLLGGALLKATLKTELNNAKSLYLKFNINELSTETYKFARDQDLEVILETGNYKFRFMKKHNFYSHVFAAVVGDNPNDTIVVDNTVPNTFPNYPVDTTVAKQVFNKVGYGIKNLNYTGAEQRIRVKFLTRDGEGTYNNQKLYETAIKWIDDPYSANQIVSDNILEITLHSELGHIDYALPFNYYYGQEINNVPIGTFLNNLLPDNTFNIYYPNYTLTKFTIPPDNNLNIIKEATFNVSIACGQYNETTGNTNIVVSNADYILPTKSIKQLHEFPPEFNHNIVYNIAEKYPTVSAEILVREFINEGEKVLLNGNLNKEYYNSYLIFRGFGEIDLLTLENSDNANIILSEKDYIKGKITANSIINNIASKK